MANTCNTPQLQLDESLILRKFDALVETGRVLYDDRQETVEHIEENLKFHFLVTTALSKKPTFQNPQSKSPHGDELPEYRRDGSDICTAGFEIGDMGNTHVLVANKYCFARPHLMLLTSDGHRRQYEPLDQDDLGAAWSLLSSFTQDYVVFYNCGKDGGCSRLHKHLQLAPMPKDTFASFLDSKGDEEPRIPFEWVYTEFGSEDVTLSSLVESYNRLLREAAKVRDGPLETPDAAGPGAAWPHNFLLTKRWMIVIPRRRGAINNEAGANALGMLGVIAVATMKEVSNWLQVGPTLALEQLGYTRNR